MKFPVASRWMIGLAAICGLALAVAAPMKPLPALAQQVDKRVDRLEKEVRALQRRVFGREDSRAVMDAPSPAVDMAGSQAANYEVRLTALENQLRRLTGEIEELRYRNEETTRRLEAFMADTELRFNEGGSGASSSGAMAEPADTRSSGIAAETGEIPESPPADGVSADLPAGTLPVGTPIQQYEYAYSLLAQGKYEAAEAAFQAFLSQHAKDDLAGNANYWLAQSYYVRGQYEKAAKSFLEGYQAYPTSPKGPDYLLKIGMSLAKIDQKQDACAVFQELQSRFPESPAAKERLAAERKAAGCS